MLEQNLLAPDAQGDWTIVRGLVFLVFLAARWDKDHGCRAISPGMQI